MIGLIVLSILVVYLGAAIWATRATVRYVAASGGSRLKRWVWGGSVALIFYLIPFWDFVPMLIAHSYLCSAEAKFEIVKTAQQWREENAKEPNVLKRAVGAKGERVGDVTRYRLNERLVIEQKDLTFVFPGVRRAEARLIDSGNAQVLAHYVDFVTGYGHLMVGGNRSWKFWMDLGACVDGEASYSSRFFKYDYEILGDVERSRR